MQVYTVYVKPASNGTITAAAEADAVFVREGFSFWAFLFQPVWALFEGLWLVAVLMVAALITLSAVYLALGFSPVEATVFDFVAALVIGFEAADMKRWTLASRGYVNRGVVTGDDLAEAEIRYYHGRHGQAAVDCSNPVNGTVLS